MSYMRIPILILVLTCAGTLDLALAQQDDRRDLLSRTGPGEFWNRPGSGGTRTDMAPKFEAENPRPPNAIRALSAEDARKACEAQVSGREVQTTLLVQQMQNNKYQIPIAQPIINSLALQAAREQAKKDCEHAGDPVETRAVWGPGK
jgi:hypothetical protein